jgi:hypothetical protein
MHVLALCSARTQGATTAPRARTSRATHCDVFVAIELKRMRLGGVGREARPRVPRDEVRMTGERPAWVVSVDDGAPPASVIDRCCRGIPAWGNACRGGATPAPAEMRRANNGFVARPRSTGGLAITVGA